MDLPSSLCLSLILSCRQLGAYELPPSQRGVAELSVSYNLEQLGFLSPDLETPCSLSQAEAAKLPQFEPEAFQFEAPQFSRSWNCV